MLLKAPEKLEVRVVVPSGQALDEKRVSSELQKHCEGIQVQFKYVEKISFAKSGKHNVFINKVVKS